MNDRPPSMGAVSAQCSAGTLKLASGRRSVKLVALFFATIAATHLAFSVLASLVTKTLEEHRLTNVRNLPGSDDADAAGLIASFVKSRLDDRRTIAIVGSSFSWGYSWEESAIYSYHLQSLVGADKFNVMNLSTIGKSGLFASGTLSILASLGVRPDYLIVEINPANFATDLRKIESPNIVPPVIAPSAPFRYEIPYLDFFVSSFFGLDFLRIIYDQYNYPQAETSFSYVPLREDYFLTIEFLQEKRDIYEAVLTRIMSQASAISSHVYIYFSPHYFAGVDLTGHDGRAVRATYDVLLQSCREIGAATCLDFRYFQDRDSYRDVSHLNRRGHAAFAVELKRALDL